MSSQEIDNLFLPVAVWHHLHGLGPKATITRDVDEAIVEKYKEEVTEKQKGKNTFFKQNHYYFSIAVLYHIYLY